MVYNRNMNKLKDNPNAIPFKPKNDIVPSVIENVLTNEDVAILKKHIAEERDNYNADELHAPLILKKMSRLQLELKYPEDIKIKLEKLASDLCGEEVVMTHNSYLDYDGKYNPGTNPSLPPHFDSDNYYTKITFDYQLDTNVDWAIIIEGKKFYLQNNQMLYFWGAGQAHWRENIILEENQKTEVLTMHFSKQNEFDKYDKLSRNQEARQERLDSTKYVIQNYLKVYELEKRVFEQKQKNKNG